MRAQAEFQKYLADARSNCHCLAYDLGMWEQRIVSDPAVLGGKPCVRGTRLSVAFILELLASGGNRDTIVKAYPQLKIEDVEAAVRFAAKFLDNDVVVQTRVAG